MIFSYSNILRFLAEMPGSLINALRHPSPYLAFDLAVIITEILFFGILTENYQTYWLDTYIFVYIIFCLSIFLKRYDPVYLSGIEWIKQKKAREGTWFSILIPVFVYFLSPVLGGFALGSLLHLLKIQGTMPAAIGVPAILVLIPLYPMTFYFFTWRGAGPERIKKLAENKTAVVLVRSLSGFGIFLMSMYMLTFVYYNINRLENEGAMDWYLRPFVVLAAMMLIVLIYMPARIHYFIDSPGDRSNRAWFFFTVFSLAVLSATGIHLF